MKLTSTAPDSGCGAKRTETKTRYELQSQLIGGPESLGYKTSERLSTHPHIPNSNSDIQLCTQNMAIMTLPAELLYHIIGEIWSMSLTPNDRVQFMTSSKLVSRDWSAVFEDLSSSNVHIPCESYYDYFFNDADQDFSACKTITFTVYDPDRARAVETPSACSLSYMRHIDIASLMSLQTINIVYHDTAFPDPYTQDFFLALPGYLPKLTISYTFSPGMPLFLINALRQRFKRETNVRYAEPRVGSLEVNGTDEFIAAVWESLFPERETFSMDGKQLAEPLLRVSNRLELMLGVLMRLKKIQQQMPLRQPSASSSYSVVGHHSNEATLVASDEDASVLQDMSRSGTMSSVASTSSRVSRGNNRTPMEITQVETDSIRFLSSNSSLADLPSSVFSNLNVSLGELGYIDKSTRTFAPLFNVLEPHDVEEHTFPSLHGYGEVHVRSVKHKRHQNQYTTVLPAPVRGRDASADDGSSVEGRREGKSKVKNVVVILKTAGREVVSRIRRRGNHVEFKYIDSKGVFAAENWFVANADMVERLYGEKLGVRKEDLVLVTGTVA
ncbi:hypothetical protein AX17_003785 [Amanita inopinata Kibby_2008]|nr:hypothetical protein AX17_003785 [Amanita inopinata Kibby_2008]